MKSDYYIDLSKISLNEFQNRLEEGPILPSRTILGENIQENFEILRSGGVKNLLDIEYLLKSKKKVGNFSEKSGVSVEYLTILRREVGSYISKPFPLSKIPDLEPAHVEKLAQHKIRTTLDLFERGKNPDSRKTLSKDTRVPPDVLLEMIKLSDLARINGVGPIFARTWYLSGVDTVEKVASTDPEIILQKLFTIYKEQGFSKIDFVKRDIEWCVKTAKLLAKVILY